MNESATGGFWKDDIVLYVPYPDSPDIVPVIVRVTKRLGVYARAYEIETLFPFPVHYVQWYMVPEDMLKPANHTTAAVILTHE